MGLLGGTFLSSNCVVYLVVQNAETRETLAICYHRRRRLVPLLLWVQEMGPRLIMTNGMDVWEGGGMA